MKLPLSRNEEIHKSCFGLCVVAAQPGPDVEHVTDPSANIFLTFNQAVAPGPCFTGDYGYIQKEMI